MSFVATGTDTRVTVEATIRVGGEDRGGGAWIRVTPTWFGRWIFERETRRRPAVPGRLALAIHYAAPAHAARWLRDVFGFVPTSATPDDDEGIGWIDFAVGGGTIIVLARDGNTRAGDTHHPWVFVDDVDAFRGQLVERGADRVGELRHHGVRAFEVPDCEGFTWTFAQASPQQLQATDPEHP